jgi:hypothetical protein
MNNYYTCKYCGANLDPGEKCDCIKEEPVNPITKKSEDFNHGNNNQNSGARRINYCHQ